MSMAEIVCIMNGPPRRSRCERYSLCHRCSIRVGILILEQFEQRLGQRAGHGRIQARHLAPAGDPVVGLDLDVRLGAGPHGLEAA